MLIYDEKPDSNIPRRSASTPQPTPPDPAAEPRPNSLTCLESRPEFEKLRAAVYQHFAPKDVFEQALADEVAEELWMKRRFSDIANQSLSLEIETAYEKHSREYPNIDSALRTVLAWKEFDKDPSCRNVLSHRTRSNRDLLNLSRQFGPLRPRK